MSEEREDEVVKLRRRVRELEGENEKLTKEILEWEEEVGRLRAELDSAQRSGWMEATQGSMAASYMSEGPAVASSPPSMLSAMTEKDLEIGRLRGELTRIQYLASSIRLETPKKS